MRRAGRGIAIVVSFLVAAAFAGCGDDGLPPGGPGPAIDLSSSVDARDAAPSTDLAHWAGDGPRVGCGSTTCAPDEVCVMPACCPQCAPIAVDGSCPQGASVGRCPVGGSMMCVTPCTPPPPRCAPIPASCAAPQPCRCLDVRVECGNYGGMCASTLNGDGYALFCLGCF